jgi:uncharacterized membrane protein YczE
LPFISVAYMSGWDVRHVVLRKHVMLKAGAWTAILAACQRACSVGSAAVETG